MPDRATGSRSHTRRTGRARSTPLGLLFAAVLSAAASAPARCVTLQGSVRVIHPIAAPRLPLTLYPRRGHEGPHMRHVTAPPGCDCIVYLSDAPPSPPPSAPDTLTMTQRGEAFVPHVLPVRVGSVVRFPNRDPFFHNVFSYSRPKRFDLGKYPTGHSKSVRFTRPGLIEVFCEIHAFMHAYILVLPHRWFDSPDADGRFTIRDVPPGRWKLAVWRPGAPETEETVVVPEGENHVEVRVEL